MVWQQCFGASLCSFGYPTLPCEQSAGLRKIKSSWWSASAKTERAFRTGFSARSRLYMPSKTPKVGCSNGHKDEWRANMENIIVYAFALIQFCTTLPSGGFGA